VFGGLGGLTANRHRLHVHHDHQPISANLKLSQKAELISRHGVRLSHICITSLRGAERKLLPPPLDVEAWIIIIHRAWSRQQGGPAQAAVGASPVKHDSCNLWTRESRTWRTGFCRKRAMVVVATPRTKTLGSWPLTKSRVFWGTFSAAKSLNYAKPCLSSS